MRQSRCQIMFLSKFSHLGARAVKNLLKGSLASTSRMMHVPLAQNRIFPPSMPKRFCTTVADKDFEKQNEEKQKISATFVDKDGEEKHMNVPVGMSMLEAAHENDIDLEGACEGSLACSTCHVIVMDVNYYNKLEDAKDEENDMLDVGFGLSERSGLGCQMIANPEIDGIRLGIPGATRNFAVDGYYKA